MKVTQNKAPKRLTSMPIFVRVLLHPIEEVESIEEETGRNARKLLEQNNGKIFSPLK